MRRSYLFLITIPLLAVLFLSSCKKKEDDTSLYMSGAVTFEFPAYCIKGDVIKTHCSGITSPSGVTYYWTSSSKIIDTTYSQTAIITIPDSVGTYSLTANASYDGYYTSTVTKTVVAIDPDVHNGSLQGIAFNKDSIIDPRDNAIYHYVAIGNLHWFSDNLYYDGTVENPVGTTYYNSPALKHLFGNLYSWKDATGGVSATGLGNGPQGACPDGWSVPTKEDWEDLAYTVSGGIVYPFDDMWNGLGSQLAVEASFNGERMWPYSPEYVKKNTFGWNAIPCGNSTDGYTRYRHLMTYGMWWSSTEADRDRGSYRYMYYNQNYCATHDIDKNDFGVSVRCVRLRK